MNRVSFYEYQLRSVASLNARAATPLRRGALLRLECSDGGVGFADCHPWAEFGDADISVQLQSLKKKSKIEPLIQQSLRLAEVDASLRAEGKSAFNPHEQVRNHLLIRDLAQWELTQLAKVESQGFKALKIKVGREPLQEAVLINKITELSSMRIRLDFNSSIDLTVFKKFVASLSFRSCELIEFVEDPFKFDFSDWTEAQKLLPIAADFEFEHMNLKPGSNQLLPFDVLVAKPARQNIKDSLEFCQTHNLRLVVTSSMDHPVGVAHALRAASEVLIQAPSVVLDSGCLTFDQYELSDFTSQVQVLGPSLVRIQGTGIGFDVALNSLDWQPLLNFSENEV